MTYHLVRVGYTGPEFRQALRAALPGVWRALFVRGFPDVYLGPAALTIVLALQLAHGAEVELVRGATAGEVRGQLYGRWLDARGLIPI